MSKSKPLTIVTDREMEPWETMLVKTIEGVGAAKEAADLDVETVSCVTLFKNGSVLTAYMEEMSCTDKVTAASHILFDAITDYIELNAEMFRDMILGEEEEDEEDED